MVEPRRVMVTGAAGFIGSAVVRTLLEQGHEVTGILRPGEDPARLQDVADRIELTEADLSEDAPTQAALAQSRPEVVIHLAWYAEPRDYLHAEQNLASLDMTTRFAQLVFSSGCRKLVGAGSCVEYATTATPRQEGDACDPQSLYASCKLAAWWVLRALASATEAELAWGRVFHLHGPEEAPQRLLPWLARQLTQGHSVDLTDGTQVRDHLHVVDVAAGFAALAQPGVAGVYNICSGVPVTLREVVEIVSRAVGRPELLRLGARPHRPGEVMFLAGDASRLEGLGWRPQWSLEDGLRDAVAGYLAGVGAEAGGGSR